MQTLLTVVASVAIWYMQRANFVHSIHEPISYRAVGIKAQTFYATPYK